ncbi:MAG: SMC-Scp complex subunit ScpB [Candidatus Marinimicrobia bacterium]|nr:SMC-Scp complex subunit ScpB [Candidatus Neomarinimicrobiota bacterium]
MNISQHIEALLFLSGKPINKKEICKVLDKDEKEVTQAIAELEKNLENGGIRLLQTDNEIMLGTAPESDKYCEHLTKEELNRNLGRAGLETLAIIIYKNQGKGVSRADIDYIRGVNSSFTLNSLSLKGLIDKKINPVSKKGVIYKPSIRLFQFLGITKKEDLPEFEKLSQEI